MPSIHLHKGHLVLEASNTRDFDFNDIAILKPGLRLHESSHPTWSSSHNNCAWVHRAPASQMPDYGRDVEDQVIGLCELPLFAVDGGLQSQLARVRNLQR